MYPHHIRLRGPWDYEPLARAGDPPAPLPKPGKITVPCRGIAGGLAGFAGPVRFRRRFGFPGRIDAHERVWLTVAGAERGAEVRLNGALLGRHEAGCPFEFEVTRLLQARNELTIDVDGSAERGGPWGEVALEVRCTAYLRQLRFETKGHGEALRLHARGEVVGFADRPLELYLLLDGRTVGYTPVTATPEGQPFDLASEDLETSGAQPREVQIDLVNGASVWYRDQTTMPARPQRHGR